MHKKQNGLCLICGNAETSRNPKTGEPRSLAVDHDHETGKIRGLLCTFCNTALGKFHDDVEILKKAIDYLISHQ